MEHTASTYRQVHVFEPDPMTQDLGHNRQPCKLLGDMQSSCAAALEQMQVSQTWPLWQAGKCCCACVARQYDLHPSPATKRQQAPVFIEAHHQLERRSLHVHEQLGRYAYLKKSSMAMAQLAQPLQEVEYACTALSCKQIRT